MDQIWDERIEICEKQVSFKQTSEYVKKIAKETQKK